jgi:pSer/pThr/pTyr-binding forkhead associated (FHA) protein
MVALLRQTLGVVCPSCDFLNVVGAVKCMSCGTATESAGAPAQAAAPPPPPAAPKPAAPPPEAQPVPPGLKRATNPGNMPAVQRSPEELGAAAHQPSGSRPQPLQAGAPARPTFQSTVTPPPPAPQGPKLAMAVVAGPARGQRFRIGAAGAQIGRAKGVILFPDDPFVSPLHATLTVRDGKVVIRDEGSTSGVYVSVAGQETIPPDSYFCTGLRLFRYAGALEPAPPYTPGRLQVYGAPVPTSQVHYQLEEILLGNRTGRTVITAGPILTIGQGKCDLSFPNDDGMAPRHCELSPMPTGAMIRDLSGGLGTFVRIVGERVLKPGDRVRIGQQTLQVEALN